MVVPPPPLSLLCIISIVTLYLMICYAVIGFIAKSEVLRVDHTREVDKPPTGLSLEELQKLRSFNHRINEGDEDSLSCAICLDDFEDFEVCKRFPSCEHVFHSHCIDLCNVNAWVLSHVNNNMGFERVMSANIQMKSTIILRNCLFKAAELWAAFCLFGTANCRFKGAEKWAAFLLFGSPEHCFNIAEKLYAYCLFGTGYAVISVESTTHEGGERRPRILWKNLNVDVVEAFRASVSEEISALVEESDANQMWNTLARIIKDATKVWLAGQRDPIQRTGNLGGLTRRCKPKSQ
ncbi:zinc finger, RING/FYVE/PHD-type [Artemisia annua]|uniref:Zinc finger, RING/FYVE/PHD-type n=1 Tax=Artemisia annua TaxID=35608 RepID=A0A2U1N384_ARTAN|nr:zinc finger, RING/FYVE/PHD-type [Artemisia annua]